MHLKWSIIGAVLVVVVTGALVVTWWSGPADQSAPQSRTTAQSNTETFRDDQTITFNEHIAPILYERCSVCHREGEVAPFRLLSYADARRHARQIVEVTARRYMPPWKPIAGWGEFLDDRSLDAGQIETIRRWVEQGAAEGDAALLPVPPTFSEGWMIGEPDLVVRPDAPFELPASGEDVYRNFVLPLNLDTTRYVRAIEIRPGAAQVIHHALLTTDTSGDARRQDRKEQGVGFAGLTFAAPDDATGHLMGWTPGRTPRPFPEQMAWTVGPGTDLVLNLHMLPTGKRESVLPSVALYFTDQPPALQPTMIRLASDYLNLPPGVAEQAVTDSFRLPVAVRLHSIYPHAHFLGRSVRCWAELPDGSQLPLVRIDDWDFDWQDEYRYRQPVALPAGTELHMQFVFDNSADNARNPHQPPRTVRWGTSSRDEMAEVWLQVTCQEAEHTAALEAAFREEQFRDRVREAPLRLRDEPDAADPHVYLGLAAQREGRLDRATTHYRRAVELDPGHVNGRNNLATALYAARQLAEAAEHFQQAALLRPDDANIHRNAGSCAAELGRWPDAAEHFRRVLQLNGDDPDALYGLAEAFFEMTRLDEASSRIDELLERDPAHAWGHLLASRISAQRRDYAAAYRHLESASKLHADWAEPLARWSALILDDPTSSRADYQRALDLVRRALQLNDRPDAGMIATRARAHTLLGQPDEARRWAKKAADLAAESKETN